MWKIALAFVVFAAGAVYLLSQGGDVSMGGETHGIDVPEHTAPAASAASS